VTSPPDVETLRLYLTLPLYHEFDNPKNYTVLHNPFGRTFLTLKTEAGKIVGEYFILCFETCSERCMIYVLDHSFGISWNRINKLKIAV
jgi:E3 ubiquitin-protein ligase HERC4